MSLINLTKRTYEDNELFQDHTHEVDTFFKNRRIQQYEPQTLTHRIGPKLPRKKKIVPLRPTGSVRNNIYEVEEEELLTQPENQPPLHFKIDDTKLPNFNKQKVNLLRELRQTRVEASHARDREMGRYKLMGNPREVKIQIDTYLLLVRDLRSIYELDEETDSSDRISLDKLRDYEQFGVEYLAKLQTLFQVEQRRDEVQQKLLNLTTQQVDDLQLENAVETVKAMSNAVVIAMEPLFILYSKFQIYLRQVLAAYSTKKQVQLGLEAKEKQVIKLNEQIKRQMAHIYEQQQNNDQQKFNYLQQTEQLTALQNDYNQLNITVQRDKAGFLDEIEQQKKVIEQYQENTRMAEHRENETILELRNKVMDDAYWHREALNQLKDEILQKDHQINELKQTNKTQATNAEIELVRMEDNYGQQLMNLQTQHNNQLKEAKHELQKKQHQFTQHQQSKSDELAALQTQIRQLENQLQEQQAPVINEIQQEQNPQRVLVELRRYGEETQQWFTELMQSSSQYKKYAQDDFVSSSIIEQLWESKHQYTKYYQLLQDATIEMVNTNEGVQTDILQITSRIVDATANIIAQKTNKLVPDSLTSQDIRHKLKQELDKYILINPDNEFSFDTFRSYFDQHARDRTEQEFIDLFVQYIFQVIQPVRSDTYTHFGRFTKFFQVMTTVSMNGIRMAFENIKLIEKIQNMTIKHDWISNVLKTNFLGSDSRVQEFFPHLVKQITNMTQALLFQQSKDPEYWLIYKDQLGVLAQAQGSFIAVFNSLRDITMELADMHKTIHDQGDLDTKAELIQRNIDKFNARMQDMKQQTTQIFRDMRRHDN